MTGRRILNVALLSRVFTVALFGLLIVGLWPRIARSADEGTTVKAVLAVTSLPGGSHQGVLTWSRLAGAQQYCVIKEQTPRIKVCLADPATSIVISPGQGQFKDLADIRGTDIFTVKAITTEKKINGQTRVNVLNGGQGESAARTGIVTAPTEFGSVANLGEYANNIMRYALPLGIALSIMMTLYAGITFMISQGQPDRIKDAQEIIQGAILGLIILITARFLVNFLIIPEGQTVSDPNLNPLSSEAVTNG